MKFCRNIAIFAGGLGTRLRGTESLPKPLVDINGKKLIERVIEGIANTGEFNRISILACKDNYSDVYHQISQDYSSIIKIKIHTEQRRSGRAGAVKYIFDNEPGLEESYFCNGDTILKDVKKLNYYGQNERELEKPVIYLADTDSTRKDYKEVSIEEGKIKGKYQNSGYFLITRSWFNKAIINKPELEKIDIDDLLFNNENQIIYKRLESIIYDAGTPERLKLVRELY